MDAGATRGRGRVSRVLILAASAGMAPSAMGIVLNWNDPTGGSAATANNWNPAQMPVAADDLVFNLTNTYTVTFPSTVATSHRHTYKHGTVFVNATSPHTCSFLFWVGESAGDSVILNHIGGTISAAAIAIGINGTAQGTVNVNTLGARLQKTGTQSDFQVGGIGTGTLAITNGGYAESSTALRVAAGIGSNGTMQITGFSGATRSTARTTGDGDDFIVGDAGTGRLDITSGGLADVGGSVIVANQTGSSGILNVTGFGSATTMPSTLEAIGASSDIIVGNGGTSASLTVSGGGRASSQRDVLIAPNTGDTGTLTIGATGSNTSVLLVAQDILVGGNRTASLNGGNGTLNVNAGASIDVARTVFIGDNDTSSSSGTLHMTGGALTAISVGIRERNAIEFSGGEIIIDGGSFFFGNSPAFGRELTYGGTSTTPRLTFQNGGSGSFDSLDVGSDSTVTPAPLAEMLITGAGSRVSVRGGSFPTLTIASGATLTTAAGGSIDVDEFNLKGTAILGGGGVQNITDIFSGSSTATCSVTDAGTTLIIGHATTHGTWTLGAGTTTIVTNAGASISVADTMNIASGAALNASNADMDVFGTLNLTGGTITALTFEPFVLTGSLGRANVTGTITADMTMSQPGSRLTITGPATIGRATSATGFTNAAGSLIINGAGVATILDSNTADIGQTLITSPGRLIAANGATLAAGKSIIGAGRIEANVTNLGEIHSQGNPNLTFTGQVSGVGEGITGSVVNFAEGGSFIGNGTIDASITTDATGSINPNGTLTLGAATSGGGINIVGTLNVGAFTVTLRDSNGADLGVLTDMNGGRIISTVPVNLRNPSGSVTSSILRGTGTVQAALNTRGGRVSPGQPAGDRTGVISVTGAYSQAAFGGSAGILDIDMISATDRDRLTITGAATLAGTLNVTFLNGFHPANGTTISFLTAASITGQFSTVNLPAGFRVVYGATSVSITSRCAADLDDGSGAGTPDGGVTIDDLLYFLQFFGAGDNRADLDDGSGTGTPDNGVTIEDLLYFINHFNAGC